MVARDRAGTGLDRAAPGGLVAVRVIRERCRRIDVVAGGPDVALDATDDRARRRVLGPRTVGDVAGPDEYRVGARDGVEGPGRTGRGQRPVADGGVPLELLAGAQAGPGLRVVGAGGDSCVLGDLGEVAARERATEEGHGERVGVGIGHADAQRRRGADPGASVGRRVERRRVRRVGSGGRDEAGRPRSGWARRRR